MKLYLLLGTHQGEKAGIVIHTDVVEIRMQAQGAHGAVVRGRLFALRVRQAAGKIPGISAPPGPPVIGGHRRRALCRDLRYVTPRLPETGQAGAAEPVKAVGEGELAAIQVAGGQVEVSPLAVHSGQAREQQVLLLAGFIIAAEIGLQFDTGKPAPGNEIHHAGDGVGAVQRRGAVLDHFNPFQRDIGHQSLDVHVTAAAVVEAGTDGTPAVNQHQRGAVTEIAQVDAGIAGGTVVSGPVGGGYAQRSGVETQVADDFLDIGGAGNVQVVPAKHRQG